TSNAMALANELQRERSRKVAFVTTADLHQTTAVEAIRRTAAESAPMGRGDLLIVDEIDSRLLEGPPYDERLAFASATARDSHLIVTAIHTDLGNRGTAVDSNRFDTYGLGGWTQAEIDQALRFRGLPDDAVRPVMSLLQGARANYPRQVFLLANAYIQGGPE